MTKAYDIVAWSVYINGHGNALALYRTGDEDRAKVPKSQTHSARRRCGSFATVSVFLSCLAPE